jgi:hypothetical protein
MALLTHELTSAAEDPSSGVICDDQWSPAALEFLDRTDASSVEFGASPNFHKPLGRQSAHRIFEVTEMKKRVERVDGRSKIALV